ncbi:hypothetical protein [Actinacidiphila glaucinigra]|uniref:hypothetical protein n=1 Tax=Actinacidiphila glaucinigra TaxID=235986 RepID=UPI002E368371|nr:hypothetical protein [Actinacidiphila glaucinigra]
MTVAAASRHSWGLLQAAAHLLLAVAFASTSFNNKQAMIVFYVLRGPLVKIGTTITRPADLPA